MPTQSSLSPEPAGKEAASSLRHLPADDIRLAACLAQVGPLLAQRSAHYDATGEFPHAHFELLQRYGLIAQVVPREFGGAGARLAQARSIVAEVAYRDAATALVLTMTYLQHRGLARADNRWPAHLRRAVYESAVGRGALINALRVEPELGSPSRGGLPATVLRRHGDGWLLSGHKLYTTGIPALSWLAVWARTDEPEPRVGVVLVPREGTAGIRVIESWNHLGLRASGSHEVIFEDVALADDHAVDLRAPQEWGAREPAQQDFVDQQAWMIVLLGALYDAVARAARDWLLEFANTRAPASLGAPLATLPRFQEQIGEVEASLHTNRVLLDDLTTRTDAGAPPAVAESALVKYTLTGNAIRVTELALQLSGNHGLSRSNPLERLHRDVLCSRIHTPQNDAILVAAGRAALVAQASASK
jgi:alkylation response protein AidB-like acyl-CoA dehydrogenase